MRGISLFPQILLDPYASLCVYRSSRELYRDNHGSHRKPSFWSALFIIQYLYYTCSIFRELCAFRGEGCRTARLFQTIMFISAGRQSVLQLLACGTLGSLNHCAIVRLRPRLFFWTPKRVLERSYGITVRSPLRLRVGTSPGPSVYTL